MYIIICYKTTKFKSLFQINNFISNVSARMLQMKKMYEFKENNERYFANVIPATEKNAFENNLLTVSPQRDQYGRRVLILQLGSKLSSSWQNEFIIEY